jgi:hypothetical protein
MQNRRLIDQFDIVGLDIEISTRAFEGPDYVMVGRGRVHVTGRSLVILDRIVLDLATFSSNKDEGTGIRFRDSR